MVEVRATTWERIDVGSDGRTLTVHFVGGVAPCYVLDRVDVDEAPDTVTVTLFQGHDPNADGACIDIGVYYSTEITLAEPLGDRVLVDGSPTG
jgi:hypothetical protein